MFYYIQKVIEIEEYTVTCLFNTGEVRAVNLAPVVEKYRAINDGLVSQLADESYFRTVQLDSYRTLCWANGVDFGPDNLYAMSEAVYQAA